MVTTWCSIFLTDSVIQKGEDYAAGPFTRYGDDTYLDWQAKGIVQIGLQGARPHHGLCVQPATMPISALLPEVAPLYSCLGGHLATAAAHLEGEELKLQMGSAKKVQQICTLESERCGWQNPTWQMDGLQGVAQPSG